MSQQDRDLSGRVEDLEREVQELRQLSRRLGEVLDVVTELLVPAMDRDDDAVRRALARLETPQQAAPQTPQQTL